MKYLILQIPEHANLVWYYFASVVADEKSTTIGNHYRSYYYHMDTDALASIPISSIFSGQTGALAKFDSVYSTSAVNTSYSAIVPQTKENRMPLARQLQRQHAPLPSQDIKKGAAEYALLVPCYL